MVDRVSHVEQKSKQERKSCQVISGVTLNTVCLSNTLFHNTVYCNYSLRVAMVRAIESYLFHVF